MDGNNRDSHLSEGEHNSENAVSGQDNFASYFDKPDFKGKKSVAPFDLYLTIMKWIITSSIGLYWGA